MKPGAKVERQLRSTRAISATSMCSIRSTKLISGFPAVNERYANGLSLWQHRVIRRYAQRQLNIRTNIVALAQAKAESGCSWSAIFNG